MPTPAPTPKLAALARLIGGTPLLEIHCRYKGHEHRVYAKHEAYNFTGSIKDRMALYILQRAYANGEIRPGDVIAEATSGNTGISFAAIGRALGHPVRIYMPDWMSRERVLVIQSLGAAVIPVSAELGGFLGSIRMADDFARGPLLRCVADGRACLTELLDHEPRGLLRILANQFGEIVGVRDHADLRMEPRVILGGVRTLNSVGHWRFLSFRDVQQYFDDLRLDRSTMSS